MFRAMYQRTTMDATHLSSSKKSGNRKEGRQNLLYITIIVLIIYSFIDATAEADWPDCNFQCKAGDVQVVDLWLGDADGNALSSCDQGSSETAYVWARIENNANDPRYALILLADVYVNGDLVKSFYDQGLCLMDYIAPKSISALPLYSFTWSCGQEVKLERLVLSWETAHGTSCDNANRECHNRNTKCFSGQEMVIQTSPQECLIQGPYMVCQIASTDYAPIVAGTFGKDYLAEWYLDGAAVQSSSKDGSLEVNWNPYAVGYHVLGLIVEWIDKKGIVVRISQCQMNVAVVPLPSAVITQTD